MIKYFIKKHPIDLIDKKHIKIIYKDSYFTLPVWLFCLFFRFKSSLVQYRGRNYNLLYKKKYDLMIDRETIILRKPRGNTKYLFYIGE